MKIKDAIKKAISLSRLPFNPMTVSDRCLKASEEHGELAEAVLHYQGKLPHKTMKEPPEGEVADVIITAVDVLAELYSHTHSNEEVFELIQEQLERKLGIWEKRLKNTIACANVEVN